MFDTAGRSAFKSETATHEFFPSIPIICGSVGLIFGSAVMIGWAFRIDVLTRILPGFATMNPATAVALMCGGLALLSPPSRIGLGRGAALAVVAIAGLKLAQLIGEFPRGVDQILFAAATDGIRSVSPSRMALSTAVALLLLGCSILANTFEGKRTQQAVQIAAAGAVAISMFNLIGYVLGFNSLLGAQTFIPMALHTALSVLILAIGSLSKRPTILITILRNRGPAGTLARTVLPLSVLIPVVLGMVRIAGQKAGYFGIDVGIALLVTGNVVVVFALLVVSVIAVHRSDFVRRQRELAVARSEDQYRLAEKVARAGHWRLDVSARILWWSDEIFNIVGIAKEQGVPDPAEILKLYHSEDRAEARMKLIRALKTGEGWNVTTRLVLPDGEVRSIISHGVCEQLAGGSVTAVFGVFADVTELAKAMHEQVLAQEKLKSVQAELIHLSRVSAMGSMASTLAHELHQPLTAIMNYATGSERMVERGAKSSELSDPLAEIRKNAARAGQVIRKLREMTRKRQIAKEAFDPQKLFKETWELIEISSRFDVKLQLQFQDSLFVMGDPIQIQQVLINLIRNACDSVTSCRERNLLVVSECIGGEVLISVEDNGSGISPSILPTLFETISSTKDDGMGIGLSISRTIIEAHGGKIWAENRPEGGARFSFSLPLAEPSSR